MFCHVLNSTDFSCKGKAYTTKFRFGVYAFQDPSLCSITPYECLLWEKLEGARGFLGCWCNCVCVVRFYKKEVQRRLVLFSNWLSLANWHGFWQPIQVNRQVNVDRVVRKHKKYSSTWLQWSFSFIKPTWKGTWQRKSTFRFLVYVTFYITFLISVKICEFNFNWKIDLHAFKTDKWDKEMGGGACIYFGQTLYLFLAYKTPNTHAET